MSLSAELLSQFAKLTKNETNTKKDSMAYGTIMSYNGNAYVKIDGSDILTPISATADAKPGDRVTITIKNHSAIVTGNISSPSVRKDDVKDAIDVSDQLRDIEASLTGKADAKDLETQEVKIDELKMDNASMKQTITAHEVELADLKSSKIDTEVADATYATIKNLEAIESRVESLEQAGSVLWSGGAHMSSSQNVTLSKKISEQEKGISLIFSEYDTSEGKSKDETFVSFFVSKELVSLYPSKDHSFTMFAKNLECVATKCLYISDDKIVGHDNNIFNGTGESGMKYSNDRFVLRYIIGV